MLQSGKLFLVLFCILQTGAFGVVVDPSCAPTCEGVTETETAVMDPTSCINYYLCVEINGEFVLSDQLECTDGEYFNVNVVPPQCTSIATAHEGYCEGYCNPCEVQCSEPSTLAPDPYNCTNYYLCLASGSPQAFSCDPGQYFDYKEQACQEDASKCYDFCDPDDVYCVEPGYIADPEDCQKYYYCDPPTVVPFSCEDDEHFEASEEGPCVDGSCKISPTSTTISTTPTTTTTTTSSNSTES